MEITTTVTFKYRLDDSEVEQFRKKVFEYIEGNIDTETPITLDDISTSEVEEFLDNELTTAIEEAKQGYSCGDCGVMYDDYFGTIQLDYCDEYVTDMVRELAEQIYENSEEK